VDEAASCELDGWRNESASTVLLGSAGGVLGFPAVGTMTSGALIIVISRGFSPARGEESGVVTLSKSSDGFGKGDVREGSRATFSGDLSASGGAGLAGGALGSPCVSTGPI